MSPAEVVYSGWCAARRSLCLQPRTREGSQVKARRRLPTATPGWETCDRLLVAPLPRARGRRFRSSMLPVAGRYETSVARVLRVCALPHSRLEALLHRCTVSAISSCRHLVFFAMSVSVMRTARTAIRRDHHSSEAAVGAARLVRVYSRGATPRDASDHTNRSATRTAAAATGCLPRQRRQCRGRHALALPSCSPAPFLHSQSDPHCGQRDGGASSTIAAAARHVRPAGQQLMAAVEHLRPANPE